MKIRIIGTIILLIGMILAYNWFGWKLCVILFIILAGNNLEQHKPEPKKPFDGFIGQNNRQWQRRK